MIHARRWIEGRPEDCSDRYVEISLEPFPETGPTYYDHKTIRPCMEEWSSFLDAVKRGEFDSL